MAAYVAGYVVIGLGVAVGAVRWCWRDVSEFGPGTFAERYLPDHVLAFLVLAWPLALGSLAWRMIRRTVLALGGRR